MNSTTHIRFTTPGLVWSDSGTEINTVNPVLFMQPPHGARKSGRYRLVVSKTKFPKMHRLIETLLNKGKCCGTHVYGLHSDILGRSGPNGGLTWSFSLANLMRCVSCFDRKCGVKATLFLVFGRLRQEKSYRWCKKCWSLVALRRWSPNTVQFEW